MQQKMMRIDSRNNSSAILIFFTGSLVTAGVTTCHFFGETNETHSTVLPLFCMAGFLMSTIALHSFICSKDEKQCKRKNHEEQARNENAQVLSSKETEHVAQLDKTAYILQEQTLTNVQKQAEQRNHKHVLELGGLAMQRKELKSSDSLYEKRLADFNKAHKMMCWQQKISGLKV